MCDCLLWAVLQKLGTEVAHIFVPTFSLGSIVYELILPKKGLGYILGDLFPQTHLVTLPETGFIVC
jgi:hypothetical protein